MKKFELIPDSEFYPSARNLFRIRALIDFGDVKAGDVGGFVEKEENLSQEGNCWIYDDAKVFENARVSGNAKIKWKASIFGNAEVTDNAHVTNNARVRDNARVFGDARVSTDVTLFGDAMVFGNARVLSRGKIGDRASIASGRDYITVGPLGSRDVAVTFYKTGDGEIMVCMPYFRGTIDDFVFESSRITRNNEDVETYRNAAEFARRNFKMTATEA